MNVFEVGMEVDSLPGLLIEQSEYADFLHRNGLGELIPGVTEGILDERARRAVQHGIDTNLKHPHGHPKTMRPLGRLARLQR